MESPDFEYVFNMQLRYNYRLDPRPRHRIAFGKAFGCARAVFNDALAAPGGRLPGRAAVPHRRGTVGAADRGEEVT